MTSPLQQLISDAEHLLQMSIPLIEDAYAFSQIVGHILVAANTTSGPPPTYYIGDQADNPSGASNPAEQNPGPQVFQVLNVNGTSGGIQLQPDGSFQVYVGGAIIAAVST